MQHLCVCMRVSVPVCLCVYIYIIYVSVYRSHLCIYVRIDVHLYVHTYVCMSKNSVENCVCACTYLIYILITLISYCIMYNLYKDVSVCENSRGFLCQSSLASVSNCQTMFKNMMSMPMPLRKKGQQLKLFISQPCLYLQILFFLSDCLHQNMMIGM